jgi:hypothetical protein
MSAIKLPELPPEVDTVRALFRGQPDHFEAQDYYYTQEQMRAYAEQAAQDARSAAIEDVACTICRRFDLNIPADLGPKLLDAIRSMSTIPEKDHG